MPIESGRLSCQSFLELSTASLDATRSLLASANAFAPVFQS